jgi:prepilin-type N-terminal cleavage/methylation domain-containing protein
MWAVFECAFEHRRQSVKKTKKGFTLIELLVVVAIIALLISILLPSLSRARELAKRLVCAANIKGIGTAEKIYANDNEEQWSTPLFNEGTLGSPVPILYTVADTGVPNGAGTKRKEWSTSTSTNIGVSRAFWLLIRSGETTQKQYICPSSGDEIDVTEEVDKYYDFLGLGNLSYGYQVPFGVKETRASENTDPRQALAADSSPYTAAGLKPVSTYDPNTSPRLWQPYNSGNHGGTGAGEGQNVLFQDSHATFERKPIVGIDNDNIYTHMTSSWPNQARYVGSNPYDPIVNPFPGQDAFGSGKHCQTDSLIFP